MSSLNIHTERDDEMKSKNQNGFVIELMIVFMLVTFAFCTTVLIFVNLLSANRKTAKRQIDSQTVLNQIGEYYMRSVEAGGTFPTGNSSITYGLYPWMDDNGDNDLTSADETYNFFANNTLYTFSDKLSATYGTVLEFYKTKSVWRRLTVRSGSTTKMILTVKEVYVDKNTSNCEILTWYIGDGVTSDRDDEFESTQLSTLQLIWKFFGQVKSDASDANLFSGNLLTKFFDIFKLLDISVNQWENIVSTGVSGGLVT